MGDVRVEVVGVFEQEVAVGESERRIPVLVLRDPQGLGEHEIRIPIGSCEAFYIQVALQQQPVARPLTHDLALRLIDSLSAELVRVVIDEISETQVHASLYLQSPQGEIMVDARPGDAVALALRADLPVFVNEEIIHRGDETV